VAHDPLVGEHGEERGHIGVAERPQAHALCRDARQLVALDHGCVFYRGDAGAASARETPHQGFRPAHRVLLVARQEQQVHAAVPGELAGRQQDGPGRICPGP
ncbi:hypothetical protein RZS08_03190, partial [Arthrospira platensis SPKY1]|nr:hypothetical protein [Arthrospira platensis SPKY1]